MLEEGPYPLELKRRIKGQEGHLSNHQAGELLRAVAHTDLGVVVLAHLSAINNVPEKAIGRLDPSDEKAYSVMPGLEHKYNSTALLLASNICDGICRYCFRKRVFIWKKRS